MLQDVLKPNAAIEETARTTPAYTFWGYTWRDLLVTLAAVIPAMMMYFAVMMLFFTPTGRELGEPVPVAEQFLMRVVLNMALTVSLLVVTHLYCHKASGRSYFSMGIIKKGAAKQYLIGLLLGLAVCAVHFGIAVGFGAFEVNKALNAPLFLAYLFSMLALAPITEMLNAGYYFGGVASSKGVVYALVGCTCVSLLLSLANFQSGVIYTISSVLMSVFLILYFLYSGSIWGAAAFSGILSLISHAMFIAENPPAAYIAAFYTAYVLTPVLGIAVLLYLLWRRNRTRVEK